MSKVRHKSHRAAGILGLAAVATTLAVCLVAGEPWASWVFDTFTVEGEAIPGTDLLLGIMIFGVLILPGLAVFGLGMIVLEALGISVFDAD